MWLRVANATMAQIVQTTNKYLKHITNALEWDTKVTTYYARHSYAARLKRAVVPISYISESLGHITISLRQKITCPVLRIRPLKGMQDYHRTLKNRKGNTKLTSNTFFSASQSLILQSID